MEKMKRALINNYKNTLEQLLISSHFLCTWILGNISQNTFNFIKQCIFDGTRGTQQLIPHVSNRLWLTSHQIKDAMTRQLSKQVRWLNSQGIHLERLTFCCKCPVFPWAGQSQLPLKWEIHISPCLWVLQNYMWNITRQHDARGCPMLSQTASSDSETALHNYLMGNTMELESVGCDVVSLLPWTSMPEWISLKKSRSWMIRALKATLCAECLQELGIINHSHVVFFSFFPDLDVQTQEFLYFATILQQRPGMTCLSTVSLDWKSNPYLQAQVGENSKPKWCLLHKEGVS